MLSAYSLARTSGQTALQRAGSEYDLHDSRFNADGSLSESESEVNNDIYLSLIRSYQSPNKITILCLVLNNLSNSSDRVNIKTFHSTISCFFHRVLRTCHRLTMRFFDIEYL